MNWDASSHGTRNAHTPASASPRTRGARSRWPTRSEAARLLWACAEVDRGTQSHFVEWNGKPVKSVKTGFGRAVDLAGLGDDVTPYTLRHTAVTWLLQGGVSVWETAGFVGMSPAMVEKVYGHHHPDFQKTAATKIGYRHASGGESLAISLADRRTATAGKR